MVINFLGLVGLMLRLSPAAVLAASVLISPLEAVADTVLTYVGPDFTTFQSDTTYLANGENTNYSPNPYSTSDDLQISITLAAPLGANLHLFQVTPLAFSVTDGIDTITNLSDSITFERFTFSTDASGQIDGWIIAVTQTSGDDVTPIISDHPSNNGYDRAMQVYDPCSAVNLSCQELGNDNTAVVFVTSLPSAAWTVTSDSDSSGGTAAPEPVSALMLATGMTLLAPVAARRRRRAAAN